MRKIWISDFRIRLMTNRSSQIADHVNSLILNIGDWSSSSSLVMGVVDPGPGHITAGIPTRTGAVGGNSPSVGLCSKVENENGCHNQDMQSHAE